MSRLNSLAKSVLAVALLGFGAAVAAQDHSQHQMPMPATPTKATPKKPVKKPVATPVAKPVAKKKPAAKVAPVKPASKTPAAMNHSAMGHDMGVMTPVDKKKSAVKKKPAAKPSTAKPARAPAAMDHSAMGHDMGAMPAQPTQSIDHSAMGRDNDAKPQQPVDASAMDHAAMGHDMSTPSTELRTPIPTLTDADRAAAFPEIVPHQMQDNDIQRFVLLDRLEAWDADHGTGMEWEGQAWIGTDLNRLWLRSEGERVEGVTESADVELLYGRSVARWWDVVAGVRHDFKPGASQDFAAIGVIGLAPQKFEIEVTAYIGTSGQTALRFEAERELLLTNRLILQPLIEVNLYGKDDPRRGIGSGLSTIEGGLRLRYEVTRKFAPYIGLVREHTFRGTADLRRSRGEDINDTRLVAGVRIWF